MTPHPLAVLGDPVRRALLDHLAAGEQTAGALAAAARAQFGIGGPAVSQHLAVLKAGGFATSRPRGRERVYRLSPEGFSAAQVWLDRYRGFWSAALGRLGDDLDRED
jgi:DNA-binding transcriptional ArsR family regulator